MISAATLVSYLLPSTRPTGRGASTTPHSGPFGQASLGIPADKIDAVLGDLHDAACREPNHNSPLAQQFHSLEDWCREPRDLLRLLQTEPPPPVVESGDRHALAIAELGHRHA